MQKKTVNKNKNPHPNPHPHPHPHPHEHTLTCTHQHQHTHTQCTTHPHTAHHTHSPHTTRTQHTHIHIIFFYFFVFFARGHITKRKDETIHTTTWTTHHQTPRRSTTQHSTSWRSATDAILPGHREHTGGSRQDTHGTPVLITIRRPWVAQPHEHAHAQATRDARHTLRTTMMLNTETGGDQTAW